MPGKRAIMRIQVDGDAKAELDKLCAKRGMTQIAVMSRMVDWFVKQDDVIQSAVLSSVSEATLAQLAKQLLKQLSSDKSKDTGSAK